MLNRLGAGAFVGLPSVELSGQPYVESSDRDDTVRIATDKRGDTVIKWKEVPKDWYDHLQHVRSVQKDVTQRLSDRAAVESILVTRSDVTFGGKNGFEIEVEVDSNKGDVSLPDVVDGVSIRRTEAPDVELKCCHHEDYDPVPGGVAVQTGGGGVGSAGFCVENSDGNRRLLTANHLWGECEDNTGGQLNQHTDEFGTVEAIDTDTDYALVRPTSTEGIDDRVYVNGIRYTVSGYKTYDGISDLISSGETCYQTGGTTCTTEGPITGQGSVEQYNCYDFEGHGIKADIYTAGGDSGGPFVDLIEFSGNQYAAIIGHLTWGDSQSTECCHWGCGYSGTPNYGPAFHNLRDSPHNLSLC